MATIEFLYLHIDFFPPLRIVPETSPHCLQQHHSDKISIQLSNILEIKKLPTESRAKFAGTVLPYMPLMPIPPLHMKIVKQINVLQKYLES